MDLTIKLPDSIANELQQEATRRGVGAPECAAQILQEHLPAMERARALRAMFASWDAQDATDDPAEIARRQEEWEQLKQSLDANRTSGRKLFSD